MLLSIFLRSVYFFAGTAMEPVALSVCPLATLTGVPMPSHSKVNGSFAKIRVCQFGGSSAET